MGTKCTYRISLAIVFTALAVISFGQKGIEDGSKYGHEEDSIRCVRGLSLSRDFVKQRDYAMALPYWKVIFDECPLASKNIYIDGVKLYKDLLDKTDDEIRKTELIDTLMLIYDRRLKYFGEKGNVRGRQGVDLLRYGRDKIENIEIAYGYLKESTDLRQTKTSDAVLASYVSSSIILMQNGKLESGQTIEDYLLVSDLLDQKIAERPTKKIKDLKAAIDENFIKEGPNQCDELISYFEPQLEKKKEDAEFLNTLTTLLRERDCAESELFYNASKLLHPLEPTAESALNLAILSYTKDEYNLSIDYYEQALTMESDEDKKADYLFGIAACHDGLGDKIKAREFARKASALRPDWGEPFILIGQLYANSKDNCNTIKLPNSVYWAAVDQFNKAKTADPAVLEKANSLILTYSRYFPNKENAFFENVTEGDTFVVGCWINETTKARFNN